MENTIISAVAITPGMTFRTFDPFHGGGYGETMTAESVKTFTIATTECITVEIGDGNSYTATETARVIVVSFDSSVVRDYQTRAISAILGWEFYTEHGTPWANGNGYVINCDVEPDSDYSWAIGTDEFNEFVASSECNLFTPAAIVAEWVRGFIA